MKVLALPFVFTFLFAIVFTACERENSEDVNQDRIYVYYELVYNATQDITYARATFFFGGITGTRLELTEPSQISADGQELTWKPLLAYYETSFAGLKDTLSFEWTDTDENVFINGVSIHEIGFTETIEQIIKGLANELYWSGNALASNETASLYINGPMEEDAAPIIQTNTGTNYVLIPANISSELSLGTNNAYLRRNYKPDIQEATSAGGEIHGIYQTAVREVELVEE